MRFLVPAPRIVGLSFAMLLGCGGPEKPAEPAGPPATVVPPQPPPPATVSAAPDAGAAPVASAPTTSPEPSLPPPKPTTIALARTNDASLDAQLAEADKAFEAGDLAKALAGYEAAKKAAPKRAAPIVGVARVKITKASPGLGFAAAEKNPDVLAASKDLKRAADLEPGFGPAQVELGRALLLLGDAPAAETALRKGVRLSPDEAEAHSALGVALLATGKAEEALTELTKAKDLDPGSAARRGNLGTVLFMRGKVPDAIREYEVQVRLSPDYPRAHSDL
jgi:tetratricopeptide (TPR) repeat protein